MAPIDLLAAPTGPDVLVVSTDPRLRDAVLTIAAGAGVAAGAAPSVAAAGPAFALARHVLVGVEVCEQIPAGSRDGMYVVGAQPDPVDPALAAALGAQVLTLPGQADRLTRMLARRPAPGWSSAGRVVPGEPNALRIGVLGALGGCGSTTLGVALALAAPGALVDADPSSRVLAVMLGAVSGGGAQWPDLIGVGQWVPTATTPPRVGHTPVLTWRPGDEPPARGILEPRDVAQALRACAHLASFTVVDLPRRCDTAALLVWRLVDVVVVVVPDEVAGVVAAGEQLRRLEPMVRTRLVVVRRRRRCGLDSRAIESALGLPVLATWGTHDTLARRADDGDLIAACGRGETRQLAAAVVAAAERAR